MPKTPPHSIQIWVKWTASSCTTVLCRWLGRQSCRGRMGSRERQKAVSSFEGQSDELPFADRDVVAIDHQFSEANVGLGLSLREWVSCEKRLDVQSTIYPSLTRQADLTSLMVSYALDLENNRELRLGLNLSGSRMQLDSVYFSANDSMAMNDPVDRETGNFKASVGAGLAYSTKRFQAGLAAWHLNGVKFASRTGETARLPVRINGHARYMIPISANDESSEDDKSWRPSMFIGAGVSKLGQLQGRRLDTVGFGRKGAMVERAVVVKWFGHNVGPRGQISCLYRGSPVCLADCAECWESVEPPSGALFHRPCCGVVQNQSHPEFHLHWVWRGDEMTCQGLMNAASRPHALWSKRPES